MEDAVAQMIQQGASMTPPSGVTVSTPMQAPAMPEPVVSMPQPVYTSAPMAMQQSSSFGSVETFFKNINWVEVLFLTAGIATLCTIAYYYRRKAVNNVVELTKMKTMIEDQQQKINAINQQAEENNNSQGIF